MQDTPEFLSDKNQWVAIFDALEIPKTINYNFNPEGAEKWLVVCRGGNTRSVALAMILKYKYGKDALTASIEKNSVSTIQTLCRWADQVIVTELDHFDFMKPLDARVRLMDLTRTERLRANPYDIPFLQTIDAKLQYFLKPEDAKRARAAHK